MSKIMLIDGAHQEETRVAVLQDEQLYDFDYESVSKKPIKGNIYLAKVIRVEPSLQAAFVEYGGNRHGFLAFTEIHPDYFRIPVALREGEEEETSETPSEISVDDQDLQADNGEGLSSETADDGEDGTEAAHNFENDDKESLEDETPFHKTNPYRSYRIQEVIKARQILLIQVVKEERGNKGAALTTFISLPGRYCVLMPNALNAGGVSRKITDTEDRKRLKKIIADLEIPDGMSLIVRTAGFECKKTEIKRDYQYLTKLWTDIRSATLKATAPALIYEEGDLIRRSIRDLYGNDITEIWVEGEEAYKNAKSFIKSLVPSHAKRVNHYKNNTISLFYKHRIEQQIDEMHNPRVKLKSGGYLIINPTEALVAIDVNSGRSTRERHIDSTALKTNLEAATEAARQIRLRDLAGLIVIDFIDMADGKHNGTVERKLREALADDRARLQVGRISQFGLLEMSRQRLRPSITESTSVPCIHCQGKGMIRSTESIALQLLRTIEELLITQPHHEQVRVFMPANIAFYLANEKRAHLSDIEKQFQTLIKLFQDESLGGMSFRIEDANGKDLMPGENPLQEAPKESKKSRRNRHKSSKSPDALAASDATVAVIKEDKGSEDEKEPSDSPVDKPLSKSQERRRSRNHRRRQQGRNKGNHELKEGGSVNEPSDTPSSGPAAPPREEKKADYSGGMPIQQDNIPSPKPRGRRRGWWKRLLDNQ